MLSQDPRTNNQDGETPARYTKPKKVIATPAKGVPSRKSATMTTKAAVTEFNEEVLDTMSKTNTYLNSLI